MRHITHKFINGRWQATTDLPQRILRANFVICCQYGDWSGFRTIEQCLAQQMDTNRPDGFYWIEER
jgi:hypothetical protein